MNFLRTAVLIVFLSNTSLLFAQKTQEVHVFIYGSVGDFISSRNNFSENYDRNHGLIYGGGFGLGLPRKLFLRGNISYYRRSGVPTWKSYSYIDGNWVLTDSRKDGEVKFSQLFVNGGMLYYIPYSRDLGFTTSSGFTYMNLKEDGTSSDGERHFSERGRGAMGWFIGIGMKKKVKGGRFSVFAELLYTHSFQVIINYTDDNGGIALTVGTLANFKWNFKKTRRGRR